MRPDKYLFQRKGAETLRIYCLCSQDEAKRNPGAFPVHKLFFTAEALRHREKKYIFYEGCSLDVIKSYEA